ncbi:MAG: hypothetical protein I3273_03930 [Candidatus Moeniiplasma glomeromycotorum]|nr:hypothetical protein [Candidatus Moeniiplasma glomeromycotorum]MCE8167694.1 hypothetical protein [Candidatus Moeniiplasma glomeromycotorum]MCE8169243.1 hypothetical protein [Candidatus Moeniiplasma glomeromycotorum]
MNNTEIIIVILALVILWILWDRFNHSSAERRELVTQIREELQEEKQEFSKERLKLVKFLKRLANSFGIKDWPSPNLAFRENLTLIENEISKKLKIMRIVEIFKGTSLTGLKRIVKERESSESENSNDGETEERDKGWTKDKKEWEKEILNKFTKDDEQTKK